MSERQTAKRPRSTSPTEETPSKRLRIDGGGVATATPMETFIATMPTPSAIAPSEVITETVSVPPPILPQTTRVQPSSYGTLPSAIRANILSFINARELQPQPLTDLLSQQIDEIGEFIERRDRGEEIWRFQQRQAQKVAQLAQRELARGPRIPSFSVDIYGTRFQPYQTYVTSGIISEHVSELELRDMLTHRYRTIVMIYPSASYLMRLLDYLNICEEPQAQRDIAMAQLAETHPLHAEWLRVFCASHQVRGVRFIIVNAPFVTEDVEAGIREVVHYPNRVPARHQFIFHETIAYPDEAESIIWHWQTNPAWVQAPQVQYQIDIVTNEVVNPLCNYMATMPRLIIRNMSLQSTGILEGLTTCLSQYIQSHPNAPRMDKLDLYLFVNAEDNEVEIARNIEAGIVNPNSILQVILFLYTLTCVPLRTHELRIDPRFLSLAGLTTYIQQSAQWANYLIRQLHARNPVYFFTEISISGLKSTQWVSQLLSLLSLPNSAITTPVLSIPSVAHLPPVLPIPSITGAASQRPLAIRIVIGHGAFDYVHLFGDIPRYQSAISFAGFLDQIAASPIVQQVRGVDLPVEEIPAAFLQSFVMIEDTPAGKTYERI